MGVRGAEPDRTGLADCVVGSWMPRLWRPPAPPARPGGPQRVRGVGGASSPALSPDLPPGFQSPAWPAGGSRWAASHQRGRPRVGPLSTPPSPRARGGWAPQLAWKGSTYGNGLLHR